jgi:hypothetical protein
MARVAITVFAMSHALPEQVRRFLLTSIPTVPHLEMLLLLWRDSAQAWSSEAIAARLYISNELADRIAEDLWKADFFECDGHPKQYRCHRTPSLSALLAAVDAAYSQSLREVSLFIHSNPNRMAVRFDSH